MTRVEGEKIRAAEQLSTLTSMVQAVRVAIEKDMETPVYEALAIVQAAANFSATLGRVAAYQHAEKDAHLLAGEVRRVVQIEAHQVMSSEVEDLLRIVRRLSPR